MIENSDISCIIDNKGSYVCDFLIKIPPAITDTFFSLATQNQQQAALAPGFKKGTTPISYIQKHFKTPMSNHLKELVLKFFGFNNLFKHIRMQKIITVGSPQLQEIDIDKDGNTICHFTITSPKELYMQSWKYLPFKAIPRKKYRDIDKQVESFLDEEYKQQKLYNNNGIQVGDWVYFEAQLIDQKNKPIFKDFGANIWLKIGDEEPDMDIQNLFVGKTIGDSLVTDNINLQQYFCEISESNYVYKITIKDFIPTAYFSIDLFKNYFKIKTQKDLHNRLIEVFSFNNDISQRRLTAFEALGLIMKKNHIVLPEKAIYTHKKQIITDMQSKSDFMVYKMDQDFDKHITEMAKRQLVDSVIAEFIAYQDNIIVTHQDLKGLLHLTQRPRIKDFIYFPFIKTQQYGHENPIDGETLYHFCLREKAINHIIHHLTKK